MKFSIASFSFHGLLNRGMIDVFGYLESIKYRYHVNAADIWNGMLSSLDDEYLMKVREALDDRGLVLANLCVDGAHVWEEDPTVREENYHRALANLRAAEILGAKTVRIDMGGQGLGISQEQFDYTVNRYREYAQRASDHGYKVGPENHWGCSRVPENIIRLARAVDHPSFGILLHFENWDVDHENGDAQVAHLAFHTHMAAWVEPRFEEKIRLLEGVGYQGYYSVEHHSAKNEYVQVEWQLASARRAARLIRSEAQ